MYIFILIIFTSAILDAAEPGGLPEAAKTSHAQPVTTSNPTEYFQTKPLTPEEIERLRAWRPQGDDGFGGALSFQAFIRSLRSSGTSAS